MIPNDDEGHRNSKNQSRDGVDFGRDAAAEPAPDFERKRVVAANQKEGDGDFVHRKGEDQQARGNERGLEIRERDSPKRLPRCSDEVEGVFLLRPVQLLQACEEISRSDGKERGAVAEENREK